MTTADFDYSNSGLTVQQAMVHHVKNYPGEKIQSMQILWGGQKIQTSDFLKVPNEGTVRLEFLSSVSSIRQGADIKVNGNLQLAAGELVPLLRTWMDSNYEDIVEYPFYSKDGLLWTWNVYEMTYPSGEKVEEKWTENAGFWVECIGDMERIYHCSHGFNSSPNFNSLVYKVSVY